MNEKKYKELNFIDDILNDSFDVSKKTNILSNRLYYDFEGADINKLYLSINMIKYGVSRAMQNRGDVPASYVIERALEITENLNEQTLNFNSGCVRALLNRIKKNNLT